MTTATCPLRSNSFGNDMFIFCGTQLKPRIGMRTQVQSRASSFSKQADRRGTSTIISTLITVCKGRQKRHELIFLLGCQSEAADRRIYVLSYLRGRPTR